MSDRMTETATVAMLKALAEPNRLQIVRRLLQGDSCNCELGEALNLAPNLLSHHLRVLGSAGLVQSRRDQIDGRWIYYAVDVAQLMALLAWLTDLIDRAQPDRRAALCGPEGKAVAVACPQSTGSETL